MNCFKVITFEYEKSAPVIRLDIPVKHAHKLGAEGGFYKVQLIDNCTDQIVFEYKQKM